MQSDKVIFRPIRIDDQPAISEMMKALYRSLQAPDDYMTDKKIAATFEQLHLQPEYLKLDVFEINGKIAGYALLFKFWYNEFGGMVWNIDELFVQPEFQRQGISSLYLSSLSKRTADRVALSIEVLRRLRSLQTHWLPGKGNCNTLQTLRIRPAFYGLSRPRA